MIHMIIARTCGAPGNRAALFILFAAQHFKLREGGEGEEEREGK